MTQRAFDVFEGRAIDALREQIGEGDLVVPAEELPIFLRWLIREFGEQVRAEIDSGKAPF